MSTTVASSTFIYDATGGYQGKGLYHKKHGQPEAVCLPIDEYEALVEFVEDMHEKNMLSMVARSRKEIENGEFKEIDELKRFLELEEGWMLNHNTQ